MCGNAVFLPYPLWHNIASYSENIIMEMSGRTVEVVNEGTGGFRMVPAVIIFVLIVLFMLATVYVMFASF